MTRAWLGLGGNLGQVRETMILALEALDARPGISVLRVSGLYETPPWGKTDQPSFVNACAEIETALSPEALLEACLSVERRLKRVRKERWGPRTIDIDILVMEGVTHKAEGLAIPHPRLSERAFALFPLADLALDLEVEGKTVADWLSAVSHEEIVRLSEPGPWQKGGPVWSD